MISSYLIYKMQKTATNNIDSYLSICNKNKELLSSISSHILLEESVLFSAPTNKNLKEEYQRLLQGTNGIISQNELLQEEIEKKDFQIKNLKDKLTWKNIKAQDLNEVAEKANDRLHREKRKKLKLTQYEEELEQSRSHLDKLEKQKYLLKQKIKIIEEENQQSFEEEKKLESEISICKKMGKEMQSALSLEKKELEERISKIRRELAWEQQQNFPQKEKVKDNRQKLYGIRQIIKKGIPSGSNS